MNYETMNLANVLIKIIIAEFEYLVVAIMFIETYFFQNGPKIINFAR